MYTPPVLLEYVPLVRRLLAASEHPDVARVGNLGEITYLVDEHVEQAEVEIYDALIASMASKGGPIWGIRRMQEQRDMFQAYVGKNLLKTGMRWVSRQYEIFVDLSTETIVHLSGFYLPDASLEEPDHATPADHARWIFEHPRDSRDDGHRVVELLLTGRDVLALSSEELLLLAKGYNWWGQDAKALEVAKLALAREPLSTEWLDLARLYIRNAYFQDVPRYLSACDACIVAGVGPAAFWYLLKADQYTAIATGESELEEFEWSPSHPILHPELLRPAAEALEAALAIEPGLRDQEAARSWVGDWNTRFAAVFQEPAFRHLTLERFKEDKKP